MFADCCLVGHCKALRQVLHILCTSLVRHQVVPQSLDIIKFSTTLTNLLNQTSIKSWTHSFAVDTPSSYSKVFLLCMALLAAHRSHGEKESLTLRRCRYTCFMSLHSMVCGMPRLRDRSMLNFKFGL